jgi:two-component sensor histidine kinase/PAS domain-containing protein
VDITLGKNALRQRSHLLVIAAAAALPFLLFAAAMTAEFDGERKASIQEDMRLHARTAVMAVDAVLGRDIAVLESVAVVFEGSGAVAAQAVIRHTPHWRGIGVSLPGLPLRPLAGVTPHPPPDLLEKVRADGRPAVSRLKEDGGEPQINVAVPITLPGQAAGELVAALTVARLQAITVAQDLPQGWVVTVLDPSRVIVARSRGAEHFVGALATPALKQSAIETGEAEASFFATNKEGEPAYFAVSRSTSTGWVAMISAPAKVVEKPLHQAFLAVLTGGGAAAVLALTLAGFAIHTISRREEVERRLVDMEARQQAERRLADVASNVPGVVYRRVLHLDGTLSYPHVSGSAVALAEIIREESKLQHGIEDFGGIWMVPEDRKRWAAELHRSAETLEPVKFEGRMLLNGREAWFRSLAHTHRTPDGAVVWDGVMLDVTDIKQAEQKLQAALAEKEMLLREIHHRVKNNLQVVSSLLLVESRQLADPVARERLQIIDRRIGVLGRIHEQLYRSDNLGLVEFGSFLEVLGSSIAELHGSDARVSLQVRAEPLACVLDTAIPLGLLANELIANAYKHAFPDGRTGTVVVGLGKVDGAVELTVADDGVGMPDELPTHRRTMGLDLTEALAAQVGSRLETTTSGRGTRAMVRLDCERFQSM